ncbi:uncharacterized protein LOC125954772 isoform X1 [Anopheles darlingi]|uniref:uncharacterized protein LOC125954772 isoform X1 n=2 Tax=Anopheles darlingi TaxID=43151 RepID=UPI0021006089|nr:uncharacterized protein LOC125954772 isoform X1 [Anopheles darlingi]
MGYKSKFVQELCSLNTAIYEELLLLVLNENLFYKNVHNLHKPSLEAYVYALLMKQRGILPASVCEITDKFQLQHLFSLIDDNHLQLREETDTLRWILSALTLLVLGGLDAEEKHQIFAFAKRYEQDLHELPLYNDVLRTLLLLAKERPTLEPIFLQLNEKKMIMRLTSESNTIRMKVLACLQTLMQFNPAFFKEWLWILQYDYERLQVEQRVFLTFQLLDTLLRLEDGREEIIQTLECDQIWMIVMDGLQSKDAVCRKEALAIIRYAISYAQQCETELSGQYFNCPRDKDRSAVHLNAYQSLATILEALNETQTHLILPALDLSSKLAPLHHAWSNLLLRMELLHENPRVVQHALLHFLKQRVFDAKEAVLENLFLQAFNQATPFATVSDTIADLEGYYNKSESLTFLLNAAQDIEWNSVPYYCIVNVIHNHLDLLEKSKDETLNIFRKCIQKARHVKNLSLRLSIVRVLLITTNFYICNYYTELDCSQVLAILAEIKPFYPSFSIALEQIANETGISFSNVLGVDSLLNMLPRATTKDSFIIHEIIVKEAADLNQTQCKKLAEFSVPLFLRAVQHIPSVDENVLNEVGAAIKSTLTRLRNEIIHAKPLTSEWLSILREIVPMLHSTTIATDNPLVKFEDDWKTMVLELIEKTNLASFDYNKPALAGQIIQLVHTLGSRRLARAFFALVSLPELQNTFQRHIDVEKSVGPVIDEIYAMIAEIYLVHANTKTEDIPPYIVPYVIDDDWSRLISLLDVGNVNVLTNVIEILAAIGHNDNRFEIVDRCYKEILNYRKADHFMPLLELFVKMLLKPYTGPSCPCKQDEGVDSIRIAYEVTNYIHQFLEQANTIYGLANILFQHMLQIPIPIILNWVAFGKILLQGMIFGDVQRRDQRIESEALEHSERMYSTDSVSYVTQADARVRVLCVQFLYRMAEANHPDATLFLLKLEHMLIERFTQITKAKERYYADSITHRQKLRIVQALCVVLKLTGTKPYPLLDVMLYETNQPNINYLIELLVADSTIDTLTIANSLKNERVKVSGVQSVFVILWLRCCQTQSLDEQYIYLLLPWTMAQNFSTRLYAQITITKMIASFAAQGAEDGSLKSIYAAVNSYLRQGNVERNIEKCMKDFRFNTVFDYANLLTLENIFHNIPKVSGAPSEDVVNTRILKECFKALGMSEINLGSALQFAELPVEKRETLFLAQSFGGADFVQRKIVPLKNIEPNQELLLGLPENLSLRKMDHTDGLIVIASLVNRAPNLGGLARTSEIFAVKQLVINSLQDIDNKEFQALSMTAEKWLNIGELKSHKIVEYLEEMKAKGYAIVGAEQTTGSKPIQQLSFPKKSILVLGHEKNGLPAEIIRHLDLIGEIPQFGVVRSLNVHVTGAIFMWEYAKQHHVTASL